MRATASVSEARAGLSAIVDRVLAGDEVTLTRRGIAVAVIVRPDVLRPRTTSAATRMADELHQSLERARCEPLDRKVGLTAAEADALVAEVRASRSRR